MNLVVGATGILGGEVCRRLIAAGKPVRGLVRPTSDPSRVEALRGLGVELATGDLKNRASLDAACAGVDAVIATASTTISRQPDDTLQDTELDGMRSLIDAAAEAGVGRFAYTSVASYVPETHPLIVIKREVEDHLIRSGLTYTILRAAHFMEIWLGPAAGFDIVNGTARVLGEGRRPYSWISIGDVAEFAVRSLENPAAANRIIELGGPEALAPLEVVKVLEEVTGRGFEVEHVPEDALRAQLAGATDPYEELFSGLLFETAVGEGVVEMEQTAREFGVELTSVRDYVRRSPAPAGG